MILPVTEVDTIKHIQKAQNSHISAFESIFERSDRQDREKRIKREKERKQLEDKKKAAILQKQRNEAKKRAAVARAKESERRRALEQNAASQQPVSEHIDEHTRPESAVEVQPRDTQVPTTGIGTTWAEVSPQQAAAYMASKTGVSAARWEGVIFRESSNNPTIVNSIGCFGYLQLHPVHGAASAWTPQQYLDKAVEIYLTAGACSWEAW